MVILLALLWMLPACAEIQEVKQYNLERDKRKHQEMLERGARQLEQAELQFKAKKAKEEQEARDLKTYQEWYNALSYEDKMKERRWQLEQQEKRQAREDLMREQEANRQVMIEAARAQERAAAMQALSMMNFGRGGPLGYTPAPSPIYQSPPMPMYTPPPMPFPPLMPMPPPVNCTSTQSGNQVRTTCY